jgi:hypothetical protein
MAKDSQSIKNPPGNGFSRVVPVARAIFLGQVTVAAAEKACPLEDDYTDSRSFSAG